MTLAKCFQTVLTQCRSWGDLEPGHRWLNSQPSPEGTERVPESILLPSGQVPCGKEPDVALKKGMDTGRSLPTSFLFTCLFIASPPPLSVPPGSLRRVVRWPFKPLPSSTDPRALTCRGFVQVWLSPLKTQYLRKRWGRGEMLESYPGEGPMAVLQGLLSIPLTFVQQPNGPRARRTGAPASCSRRGLVNGQT